MSTKGGPFLAFSLPGGRLAPLPPCQVHHWSQTQTFYSNPFNWVPT